MREKGKKGFTLIELLAVIVILAVIALIATPIVLDIVERARKSAFENTAYGLMEAAKLQYAEGLLEGTNRAQVYDFRALTGKKLQFSGSEPESGIVVVDEIGNVGIAINNGTLCALKTLDSQKPEISEYNSETCKLDGYYVVGSEIIFNPGDEDRTWNVISDNGDTVTLMMNENLGDTVVWNSSNVNSDGPVTALNALNDRTSTWKNVDLISSYEYINNENTNPHNKGYRKLMIVNGVAKIITYAGAEEEIEGESRARFITGEEFAKIINDKSWTSELYSGKTSNILWLKAGLNEYNNNNFIPPIGYWTLTSRYKENDATYNRYVWIVSWLLDLRTSSADLNDKIGIRPVIEISKDKLL